MKLWVDSEAKQQISHISSHTELTLYKDLKSSLYYALRASCWGSLNVEFLVYWGSHELRWLLLEGNV